MIEYVVAGEAAGGRAGGDPLWSRDFLQPLAPGPLTPFSASVLTETAGSSWYNYFDRLDFDPAPKARVVRNLHGRPYFTLTLSAQLDAQQAGIEPPSLRINGSARPLARWEKPNLFAGLKLGGGARKIAGALQALDGEIDAATAKAQSWLQRVQAMHWSQAEILQIMEEIERLGGSTLQLYVAARHNLQSAYLRLQGLLEGMSSPQQLAALNLALHGQDELVELQIARAVADLAAMAPAEPAVLTFLQANDFSAWAAELVDGPFAVAFHGMLAAYGHRCVAEGELMTPRWSQDPTPLLTAIAAAVRAGARLPAAAGADEAPFLALLDRKRRKEAQPLLQQARRCLALQSRALHAHAYTLAGTRIWALAAGHEAMSDQRLLAVDDIFFYELEETKQMMTGEWNISDLSGIHATAAARKAEWQRWQDVAAGDLLVADCEAAAQPANGAAGLPGAAGKASGPVVTSLAALANAGAGRPLLVGVQADAGWAAALPVAAGFILAQGSPLDPLVAAAAQLQIPVVYDLGAHANRFRSGQFAAIDGELGTVTDEH